jgi:hypothetical protein
LSPSLSTDLKKVPEFIPRNPKWPGPSEKQPWQSSTSEEEIPELKPTIPLKKVAQVIVNP